MYDKNNKKTGRNKWKYTVVNSYMQSNIILIQGRQRGRYYFFFHYIYKKAEAQRGSSS